MDDGLELDAEPVSLVVHLVHGTWPYGLFRTRPKSPLAQRAPEWFEPGSETQQTLRDLTDAPLQFESFCWSGGNSFRDRNAAARALHLHLEAAIAAAPRSEHVVIAHSHGGTVAANALTRAYFPDREPPVRALVCLATPFAYTLPATKKQASLFAAAVAGLVEAVASIVAITTLDLAAIPLWLIFLAQITTLGAVQLFVLSVDPWPYWAPTAKEVRNDIALFSLRTTRDEAALVIGFAQSVRVLTAAIFHLADEGVLARSWAGRGLGVAAFLLVVAVTWTGVAAVFGGAGNLDLAHAVAIAVGLSPLLPAVAVLLSQTTLAALAGLRDPRYWAHHSIEVDATPPNKACEVKSYPYFDDPHDLRHGLYRNPRVLIDVAELLTRVSRGDTPRLLPEDELSDRLRDVLRRGAGGAG